MTFTEACREERTVMLKGSVAVAIHLSAYTVIEKQVDAD
jgi:hypothetical protein